MHFRSMAILVLTSMGLAQALPATAPANPGKAPRKATGLRPSGAVPVPISGHVGADDPVIIRPQHPIKQPTARRSLLARSSSAWPLPYNQT